MLDFSNAKILAYSHAHKYFSENLNYAVEKHLTINGSIYALTNQAGVTGIWSGMAGFVNGATDYDSVIINGTNFGQGRINNINFSEGNDVRIKNYQVDLTILSSGNLYNMQGSDFNGVVLSGVHLLENFSENFDFSIALDGTYNYKQTVNVKYPKIGPLFDPISAAKNLASGLLFSTPAYGFIDTAHAGFYTQTGRRTYTENYNKMTNECSFSENFTQPQLSGDYAIKYTQEINTAEDGISTVSENGHIESINQTLPEDAFTTQKNTAYARASTLLLTYITSPRALNTSYLTLRKVSNQFTNSIDYTIQYNNDPRNQNTYSWDYNQDISRGDECYYKVREAGRIKGISNDCSRSTQYTNALAGWATVKVGIPARVQSVYSTATHLSTILKPLSTSERKSEHAGEVSYDYIYTDDLTFRNDQDIRRIETDISDEVPTPLTNRFIIGGVGELVQDLGIAKEGKRNITIKMIGKRGTVLNTYLDTAKTALNGNKPNGTDVFIDGCNYSFTPTENSFNLQLTWIYFGAIGGLTV